MKTRILAGLAALTALATPVAAADLSASYGYAPQAALPTSWNGFYIGANAGYGWGSAAGDNPNGAIGGFQAGFNFQGAGSPIVFGVETDFDWSGVSAGSFSVNYLGTVRGRVGFAAERFLVYATGGLAYGEGQYQVFGLSNTQTSYGWTLGAGAEYALDRNWSARAEYLYVDLGSSTYGSWLGTTSIGYDGSVVRAGVNYRF